MNTYDLVTCCKCNLVKKRLSLGNNRYTDEVGGHWRSRCCPQCSKQYQTKYRKDNNLLSNFDVNGTCISCDKHFIKQEFNSKYCSIECRNNRNKLYYRNKQGFKGKNKPRLFRDYRCQLCFKSITHWKLKLFCSKNCYTIHKSQNKKVKEIKIITPRNCKGCSIEFIPKLNRTSRQKNRKSRRTYEKLREKKKIQRVPVWANVKQIEQIYKDCPPTHHVDHIIPLNGNNVCGFHVEYNLQLLSAEDNILKSNKFDGTYENLSWKKKT